MMPIAALGLWLALHGTPLSGAALDARTRDVAATLRCPACEDVSIEDSPADLARDMRRLVREQLAAGATPAQVRQYFVDRYGEWVLLSPRPTSRTAPLWIVPLLAIGVAGAGLVHAVRRWTHAAPRANRAVPLTDRRDVLTRALGELARDWADGKVTTPDFERITRQDQAELAAIDAALRHTST
jgi:cytochrome c-type biogenesis protein CcmH